VSYRTFQWYSNLGTGRPKRKRQYRAKGTERVKSTYDLELHRHIVYLKAANAKEYCR
jgi:hypothetical protein